jgi:hypothetical protein
MRVRRFDIGGLEKPVKEPNGWVRVDAYLARTGVQAYVTAGGKQRLEYRPPEEVFETDSLASFKLVPFTNDHPPEALDDKNTKTYAVGAVEHPQRDGNRMRASILVTDAATVADMEKGKLEISNGYFCELDETPGMSPDGERYDAVQRVIRGNHVALVAEGRAGPDVRARFDASDATMVLFKDMPTITRSAESKTGEQRTMKLKVDGIEVEVADATAQLIEKERSTSAAAFAETKKAADQATARADAAETELKNMKAALDAAPEKLKAEMQARTKLEQLAKTVCGAETKTDGVDDKTLRQMVAATQAGDVKLEDKSDAYIDALIDLASKKSAEKQDKDATKAKTAEIKTVEPGAEEKDFFAMADAAFKARSAAAKAKH